MTDILRKSYIPYLLVKYSTEIMVPYLKMINGFGSCKLAYTSNIIVVHTENRAKSISFCINTLKERYDSIFLSS